ncbi:MAG: bifunctional nuclease family protein [Planctomycetota bacterium]|nr:MAG: bifunctional nuclease family protein [Planctomycetota bacterium]
MGEKIQALVSDLILNDKAREQYLTLSEAEPQDQDARQLTMVIGPGEAQEICRCLYQSQTPRPLTHELMFNIMQELQAEPVESYIFNLKDQIYFAKLSFRHLGSELSVDCRPSDAIALSLRGQLPIFVDSDLMAVPPGPADSD